MVGTRHKQIYSTPTYPFKDDNTTTEKFDTQYNNREIEYIDHNYSSDASSV